MWKCLFKPVIRDLSLVWHKIITRPKYFLLSNYFAQYTCLYSIFQSNLILSFDIDSSVFWAVITTWPLFFSPSAWMASLSSASRVVLVPDFCGREEVVCFKSHQFWWHLEIAWLLSTYVYIVLSVYLANIVTLFLHSAISLEIFPSFLYVTSIVCLSWKRNLTNISTIWWTLWAAFQETRFIFGQKSVHTTMVKLPLNGFLKPGLIPVKKI